MFFLFWVLIGITSLRILYLVVSDHAILVKIYIGVSSLIIRSHISITVSLYTWVFARDTNGSSTRCAIIGTGRVSTNIYIYKTFIYKSLDNFNFVIESGC